MNKITKSTGQYQRSPFVKLLIKVMWAFNIGYVVFLLTAGAHHTPSWKEPASPSEPTQLVEPTILNLSSTKEPAKMPNEKQWCLFQYHLTNKNYRLCSIKKLSKAQLLELHNQLVGAQMMYEIYVKETYAIDVKPPQNNIDIFLIDYTRINNERNFTYRPETGPVVGRYFPKTNWLFITDRVFTPKGETDFPHEVAHWLNEDIGIADSDNEPMVRKFEEFYRANLR